MVKVKGSQASERASLEHGHLIYEIEVYTAVSSSSAAGEGPLVAYKVHLDKLEKGTHSKYMDTGKETCL